MSILEIHTLGVAQGDSQVVAVRDDNGNYIKLVLIDTGKEQQSPKVYNYIKSKFPNKNIDYLIITHWDTDHYAGADILSSLYDASCICYAAQTASKTDTYRKIVNKLQNYFGANYINLDKQMTSNELNICISDPIIDDVYIRFIIADEVILQSTRKDDTSITNKSSIGLFVELSDAISKEVKFRYFTAGDLDFQSEDALIEKYAKTSGFKIHSAKLSHHGANNSTSEYFIQESGLHLAIASFAGGNRYNHPHPDVITDLKSNNVQVLLTAPIFYSGGLTYENNLPNISFVGNIEGKNNIIQEIKSKIDSNTNTLTYHWISSFEITDCQYNNLVNPQSSCQFQKCYNCYVDRSSHIIQGREITPAIIKTTFTNRAKSLSNKGLIAFINDFTDKQFAGYFPSQIDLLLGEITIQPTIVEKGTNETEYELQINKKFNIFEKIAVENPSIKINKFIVASKTGNSIFLRVRLSSEVDIGQIKTYFYVDFASGSNWEFTAEPKKNTGTSLSFADIASAVPDFDSNLISDWSSRLGLDNLKIKRLKFGVVLSTSNFNYDYMLIDLSLSIFKTFNLLLSARYSQDGILISGRIENEITLYKLLEGMGLSSTSISCFPDLVIDDFGFSANPKSDAYSIYASCSDLAQNLNILKTDIQLSAIAFTINKSISGIDVHVEIEGGVGDSLVVISGEYTSEDGFIFNGNISSIDSNKILANYDVHLPTAIKLPVFNNVDLCNKPLSISAQTVATYGFEILDIKFAFGIKHFAYSQTTYSLGGLITLFDIESSFTSNNDSFEIKINNLNFKRALMSVGVGENIASYFNLEFKETIVRSNESKFEFASKLGDIQLGDSMLLTANEVGFYASKEPTLGIFIQTTLKIQFDETTELECISKLSISKTGFNLSALTKGDIRNVFGIKDFNFGAVYLTLNGSSVGVGVGFKGNLRFKSLSGQVALYFSASKPDDKLLAVNLKSLNLKDIVECFVEGPSNGDILKEIGINPILLPNIELESAEITDAVKSAIKVIDNDSTGNLILSSSTDSGYSWIPENTYLIEDKSIFKSYMLSKNESGKYILEKWVSLYGCTSATGIVLDDCKFEPGFAFSGELSFLKVKQQINFSAMPKRGLQINAEMVNAIEISNGVILLSRVDDASKGPFLSLSTYADKQHFQLNAKLKILSIINYHALIIFERDRFAFALSSEVLGFRTAIKAAGEFSTFEKAAFELDFLFETSGFSGIASEISNKLHDIANDINNRTKDANSTLASAQRTVDEYLSNIGNVENDINSNENELRILTNTSYPWYKAYMYPILAAKITFVSAKIAGLYTYKGTLYVASKAAYGALELAKILVKGVGAVASTVIEGVADITKVLGNAIDWVIKINRIHAGLKLNSEVMVFDFDFDFILCGSQHTQRIKVELNVKSLGETIKQSISSLIKEPDSNTLRYSLLNQREVVKELDGLYGKLDHKLVNRVLKEFNNTEMLGSSPEMLINNSDFRKISLKFNNLTQFLVNDFQQIQTVINSESNNSYFTNKVDKEAIQQLKDLSSDLNIDLQMQSQYFDSTQRVVYDSLTNQRDTIKSFIQTDTYKDSPLSETERNQISDKLIEFENLLDNFNASMTDVGETPKPIDNQSLLDVLGKFGTNVDTVEPGENNLTFDEEIIPTDKQKMEIIRDFETLTSSDKLTPYMKSFYYMNLGRAYKELGDLSKSIQNFNESIIITEKTFGENSIQVQAIRDLMN